MLEVRVLSVVPKEQSSALLSEMGGSNGYTAAGLLVAVGGLIPKVPSIPTSIAFLMLWAIGYQTQAQIDSVADADNYALVITTYRYIDDSVSVVTSGWDTYPMIYLPHNLSVNDADFEPH